jgi:flagellar assembly factor FliW
MDIDTRSAHSEIDANSTITLPKGMAGFENLTRFQLFHEEGKPTVFWLQSAEDPDIQFSVVDPSLLNVAYELTLSDDDLALLKLDSPEDLSILVTLAKDPDQAENLHANFMSPLLINTRERLGLQKAINRIESQVLIRAE